MKETFFSPADILLPPYTPDDPAWCKWSVIACDQFTSEKQYWDSVAKITEGAPSHFARGISRKRSRRGSQENDCRINGYRGDFSEKV